MALGPPISKGINLKRGLHIVSGITTSFRIQLWHGNVSRTVGRRVMNFSTVPMSIRGSIHLHARACGMREMMNYGRAANADDAGRWVVINSSLIAEIRLFKMPVYTREPE